MGRTFCTIINYRLLEREHILHCLPSIYEGCEANLRGALEGDNIVVPQFGLHECGEY